MIDPEQPTSVYGHILRGSIWMQAMRWGIRGIGLVSTIILARLLIPEDFGIVAMAMIVVGFIETFAHAGVDLALIQNKHATASHFNTAWTIQICQGAALALCIFVISPFVAKYFNEPRVGPVVQLLALRALIGGFENIGVVAFRKELDFRKDFQFGVYRKILAFFIAISLAIVLRNYWALAIGIVAASLGGVLLSYVMHPYRPRLGLAEFRAIWRFSRWILLWRVAFFLNRRTDHFLVGGLAGTGSMGHYFVGSDIATMPTSELVAPLDRALFPGYAKLVGEPARLSAAVVKVLGLTAMLCFSIGFGLSAVAEDVVAIVLGAQWRAAVPLIEWLAVFGAFAGIIYTLTTVLFVADKGWLVAMEGWIRLSVLAPLLYFAGQQWGVQAIAVTQTVVTGLFLPVMVYLVSRSCRIPAVELFGALLRPFVAAVVMAIVVRIVHADVPEFPALALSFDVLVGGAVFTAATLALWLAAGRPEGPERTIISSLARVRGHFMSR